MHIISSLCCSRQLLLSLALAFVAIPVRAVPDAGSLLRDQESLQRQLPSGLPELLEEVRPMLVDLGGEAVVVKGIRLTGAAGLIPAADLQRIVADATGKAHTFSQLNQLAQRVTDLLKSKGFLLARAYLPRQDVTGGEVEIFILQGRLDGTATQGAYEVVPLPGNILRIKPEVLSKMGMVAMPAGEPLRQGSLERVALLINDLPGIQAKIRLVPGGVIDSTRILLDVSEKSLVSSGAWVDFNGSSSTGVVRANASITLNDPLRIGDQFDLSGMHSSGVDIVRVGYSLPVGSSGLRAGLDLLQMKYQLSGGVASAASLNGGAQSRSVNVAYPFVRSRLANLRGSVGYVSGESVDRAGAAVTADKLSGVSTVGLSGDVYDSFGGGGQVYGSIGLSVGNVDLSRNAANASDVSKTYRYDGGFTKLNYSLARLQKLPANFTLYAGVIGQLANKNLDSSQNFSLGGPASLRAYPSGEASGAEGWLANLELRYELPVIALGRPRLVGFFDMGGVKLYKDTSRIVINTATKVNDYTLSGFGVAAELSDSERYQLRLIWAQKLGGNPGRTTVGMDADGRNLDNRFWFQSSFRF